MSRNDLVEISAELRKDRPNSWGVWQGDWEDQGEEDDGPRREKWIWLPKSCCQQGEAPNTWLVPEWLAAEKGLI